VYKRQGAPAGHTTHGLIHGLAGLATFALLTAACWAMTWRFTGESAPGWTIYSLLTGLLIVSCFIASNVLSVRDAAGAMPNAPTGLVQRIAIVGGWSWVALLAVRQLSRQSGDRAG